MKVVKVTQVENIARQDEKAKIESESNIVKVIQAENIEKKLEGKISTRN